MSAKQYLKRKEPDAGAIQLSEWRRLIEWGRERGLIRFHVPMSKQKSTPIILPGPNVFVVSADSEPEKDTEIIVRPGTITK